MHLEILDLDGGSQARTSATNDSRWQSVRVCDLSDLAARLRLWSAGGAIKQARRRLQQSPTPPDPTITLVGSGDYHHLTALLLERACEPITLIHFDNHPDWVQLAPRWHCGSWINQALQNERVKRVVTIGPCSDDLVWPGVKGGNLKALSSGRLRLFPWSHPPSRVLRSIGDGASYRCVSGHLIWNNLAAMPLEEAITTILAQVTTDAIWITIDKDVLPPADAVCNWDQGLMPLDAVVAMIQALGKKHPIAGADICGDYAPPRFRNPLKTFEVFRDQPRRPPPPPESLRRNTQVNDRLLDVIEQAARTC